MNITITVCFLLVVFLHPFTISSKAFEEKKYIIGLIAKCENQQKQHIMGMLISERLAQFITTFQNTHKYAEFDVCENRTILMHHITDIFLNVKWYGMRTNVTASQLTVKYIITFMPDEMEMEMAQVVSSFSANIYILSLTKSKSSVDSLTWRMKELFIRSKIKNPMFNLNPLDVINKTMKHFQCNYFTFIEMSKISEQSEQKSLTRAFPNTCFKYTFIDNYNSDMLNKTIKILQSDKKLHLVFLLGNKEEINFFVKQCLKWRINKYWVLLYKGHEFTMIDGLKDFTLITYKLNTRIDLKYKSPLPSDRKYSEILKELDEPKHRKCRIKRHKPSKSKPKERYLMEDYSCVYYVLIPERVKSDLTSKVKNYTSRVVHTTIHQYINGTPKLLNRAKEIRVDVSRLNQTNESRCHDCDNCKTSLFKNINYYQKICSSCQQDFYFIDLPFHNGVCRKCKSGQSPTKDQRSCYTAAKPQHIHIACYFFNWIGFTSTLTTVVAYWRHRHTPVIRSSNCTLSFLQLLLSLLSYIFANVLFELSPSELLCVVRPYVLGLLFIGIISIVVCKAEKILMVFESKVRLTKKELYNINVRLLIIVVVLVAIGGVVLSLLSLEKNLDRILKAETREDHGGNKYYVNECSSDKSFSFLMIYCIVLLLVAIIQGYRSRKLPVNYNEGISIIVAASTTMCSLVFMIWMMHSGKYQDQTASIVWCSLSVSMLCLLLSIYGPKLFIILFRSEKNTREHHLMLMVINSRKRSEKISKKNRCDGVSCN